MVEGFEGRQHIRFLEKRAIQDEKAALQLLRQNKLTRSPAPGRQSLRRDLNPVGGSPTGAVLLPRAPGTMPEDTLDCHIQVAGRGGTSYTGTEVKDAATMHRTAPLPLIIQPKLSAMPQLRNSARLFSSLLGVNKSHRKDCGCVFSCDRGVRD